MLSAPLRRVFATLSLILAVCSASMSGAARVFADDAPVTPDHPVGIIAAASIDRLLDQSIEVLRLSGRDYAREDLISMLEMSGIGDGLEKLSVQEWLDTTRPIGILFFYGTVAATPENPPAAPPDGSSPCAGQDDPPEEVSESPAHVSIPFTGDLEAAMAGVGSTFQRAAIFVPVKNYQRFLSATELTPVAGKANCYRDAKGQEHYWRKIGDFAVGADDRDVIEYCPDPRGIVRPLLGKNDLVVSFQTKGLPSLWRTIGAAGVKSVFDATLQQRDDEPERDYLMRRATGDIARELLDIAVSHIDDINLGVRFDKNNRQFVVDFDLAGPKDGKLAKLTSELLPKRTSFESAWALESQLALEFALSIPQRHAKALLAAIQKYVANPASEDERGTIAMYAPAIDVGRRMLEARQLDVMVTGSFDPKNGFVLWGIKVPTTPKLPEQVHKFVTDLAASGNLEGIGTAVGEINGWPVHQFTTSLFGIKTTDAAAKTYGGENQLLVATPDFLWIWWSPKTDTPIPDALRQVVEAAQASSSPSKGPHRIFRLKLHTRNWGPLVDDDDSAATESPDQEPPSKEQALARDFEKQAALKRQLLFDENSDRILVEAESTTTGLKVTAQFDAVYPMLFVQYLEEFFGDDPTPAVSTSDEPVDEK